MTDIVLVGEARGEQEAKIGTSFVGPSGVELLRMLHDAKIIQLTPFDRDYISRFYRENDPHLIDAVWQLHPEVFRTNVFQLHPPNNDLLHLCGNKSESIPGYPMLGKSKFIRKEFAPELERLSRELIDHDPNIVVCLGNTALWALAGKTAITKFRGTTLLSTHTAAGFKLLPTYHPAAILRQWDNRPTVIADLIKAEKESHYAEIRRPHREIWIEPSLEDIRRFIDTYIRGCRLLSIDIETSGSRVTCIGFAPSADRCLVVPFDDKRSTSGSYWPTGADEAHAWRLIAAVLHDATIPKLFQNGVFDLGFLYRAYGFKVKNAAEDTMLLSHALQPEALKGLGYLGSIHSDEGAWKHMRVKNETIKRDA